MGRLPPPHLTDFGVWLWWRFPRWKNVRLDLWSLYAFRGISSYRYFNLIGMSWNGYDGMWPWPPYPRYWRFTAWIFGRPVYEWNRPVSGTGPQG